MRRVHPDEMRHQVAASGHSAHADVFADLAGGLDRDRAKASFNLGPVMLLPINSASGLNPGAEDPDSCGVSLDPGG
jgi:hypothetical protein